MKKSLLSTRSVLGRYNFSKYSFDTSPLVLRCKVKLLVVVSTVILQVILLVILLVILHTGNAYFQSFQSCFFTILNALHMGSFNILVLVEE